MSHLPGRADSVATSRRLPAGQRSSNHAEPSVKTLPVCHAPRPWRLHAAPANQCRDSGERQHSIGTSGSGGIVNNDRERDSGGERVPYPPSQAAPCSQQLSGGRSDRRHPCAPRQAAAAAEGAALCARQCTRHRAHAAVHSRPAQAACTVGSAQPAVHRQCAARTLPARGAATGARGARQPCSAPHTATASQRRRRRRRVSSGASQRQRRRQRSTTGVQRARQRSGDARGPSLV